LHHLPRPRTLHRPNRMTRRRRTCRRRTCRRRTCHLAAVDRANAAWARAKATLDITALSDAVAGQELARDIAEVQQLQDAGHIQKSVNTAFLVLDVALDEAGHAIVHTTETWSAEIHDAATDRLLQRLAPATYLETYVLEYSTGGWIVIENDL
jgi:hypothetical protein